MEKRVLLLADAASSHTEKWALALASNNFTIGIFSLNKVTNAWYRGHHNIILLNEPSDAAIAPLMMNKFRYLKLLPKLLDVLKIFKPDVLHAHYATSYGLLGALSQFRPFVLSAWGSDVFEFPKKSIFHRYILKYNLKRADKIFATSFALKGELCKYSTKEVQVISFGVDTGIFYPDPVKPDRDKEVMNIGTIKSMDEKYGIDTILEAIKQVKQVLPRENFKLYLVGGGKLEHYKKRARHLGLDRDVVFTGKVPFKKIPHYHNLLDIFLNVSIVDESFGVAVIEAMACGKPVIVSKAPGLLEIVGERDDLALVVEKNNATQLSEAIIKLILSPDLRSAMGKAGRRHVLANYDFEESTAKMIGIYQQYLPEIKKTTFTMHE